MFMTGVLCTVCGAQVYLQEVAPAKWHVLTLNFCQYAVQYRSRNIYQKESLTLSSTIKVKESLLRQEVYFVVLEKSSALLTS